MKDRQRETSGERPRKRARKLSAKFGRSLIIAVVICFVLFGQVGWLFTTANCVNDAKEELSQQVEALTRNASIYGSMADVMKELDLSSDNVRIIAQTSVLETIRSYRVWDGGIVMLVVGDKVVASNEEQFEGMDADGALGEPARRLPFMRLLDGDDLDERVFPGHEGVYFAKVHDGMYEHDGVEVPYGVIVALPYDKVFYYRPQIMGYIALALAVLLALTAFVVMRLLRRTVVQNIDAANEVLGEITAGDLTREVAHTDIVEFNVLSDGINATVESLKESMADIQGRIGRELSTAKAIQESALPNAVVPFPEVGAFDLFASMKAAREIGGDFYDFFLLDENRLGFVIADVSGKGVPAALYMMAAKTEIRGCIESGMGLAESMRTANYQLCQGNDGLMFVTVFAAILDYETGRMAYVNAGHNPPLLRRGGQWEWLRNKSGVFLGAYPDPKYREYEVRLSPDDMLFCYTDGVTEAWNPDEQPYGGKRLEAFLQSHADLHPRALAGAVSHDITAWADGAEQTDDITMLVLEFGVEPIVTDTVEVPARVDQLDSVTRFVDAELANRMCPVSVQHKVDICLEELFVNVCDYAYGEGTGKAWVTYTYLPNPTGIRVDIADAGMPFDPLAKPDPNLPKSKSELVIGGLGIFMTKNMADDITYRRKDNRNITSFELHW